MAIDGESLADETALITGAAGGIGHRCKHMARIRSRSVARVLILVLLAGFLWLSTRVSTRHPSHPYVAPDFTLEDLNGNPVRLSAFRGKAVVLNFWASWCAPCRRETPWLIELQREYGPRGLQVISISMDDGGKGTVETFVKISGIEYPVLLDDGRVGSLYDGIEILPTTYYISRDGRVLAFVKGVVSKGEVERNIKELLGVGGPTKPLLSCRASVRDHQ